MIKENQQLFNRLHVISDGIFLFLSLPVAFWLRFYVLPNGIITVPLSQYMLLDIFLTAAQLFTYASFGLYQSFRKTRLKKELPRLWLAGMLDMAILLSVLFINHGVHYSRLTMAIYFTLSSSILSGKRIILRKVLRYFRQHGHNLKHILILGSGESAKAYLDAVSMDRELGYHPVGYLSQRRMETPQQLTYLGSIAKLDAVLDQYGPDEVVSAVDPDEDAWTPQVIMACEKAGVKLSIIPTYARYMSSTPQFDELNGLPLLNIRRIPLDNWANAFCKRAFDILGSLLLILFTSPIMLLCALGVKLTSPGPVIFSQKRVGRNKKEFYMYKFRSMRVNNQQDTGWSNMNDNRKTRFGAFLRKCSLDEFPQFFNVLKGDMSLVGPRPEIPYHVGRFKEDIPLYMVKHQVRPGITGWAQVNDLRGDTSIKERIEHDIYYIENWSLLFDLKILFLTVFKGKFLNSERLI